MSQLLVLLGIIRLMASIPTMTARTERKLRGVWREERQAGRGAGALQLNIHSGDNPPLGRGELRAAEFIRYFINTESCYTTSDNEKCPNGH